MVRWKARQSTFPAHLAASADASVEFSVNTPPAVNCHIQTCDRSWQWQMPPALAKAAQLTDAQVEATREYSLLTQLSTIGGIKVSAGKGLWPDIADVPDTVFGVINQWVNKRSMTIKVTWTEANGEERYDVEDLHILLLPHCEFKLLKGPQGEALLLRGAARADHQARQPKRKVIIKYTEGALEKEQVWEVEDDPEACRVASLWQLNRWQHNRRRIISLGEGLSAGWGVHHSRFHTQHGT
jgi:hypothetical protein